MTSSPVDPHAYQKQTLESNPLFLGGPRHRNEKKSEKNPPLLFIFPSALSLSFTGQQPPLATTFPVINHGFLLVRSPPLHRLATPPAEPIRKQRPVPVSASTRLHVDLRVVYTRRHRYRGRIFRGLLQKMPFDFGAKTRKEKRGSVDKAAFPFGFNY
ncbi:hypothetical protein IMY05_005G0066100 [Salix suchowensis]|nr:hypothetical protein IMY05_005G0066100 [Salix suchowensis]